MRSAVVVDSGPLIALFDRDDAWHDPIVKFLKKHAGLRLVTTWAVLNETSALLGSRVGKQAELDFLAWVERGGLSVAPQEPAALHASAALHAIRALIEKYRDMPFDFAGASVAVLAAETGIAQVLTLDRDFDIYRDSRGKRLRNLLASTIARTR